MKVGRFDLPFLCSVFVERKAESGVSRWTVMNAKNYEGACVHCDFCEDGDWKIKHKPKCYVE